MKVRHFLRLYYTFMARAEYCCEQNHAIDYGEWSSKFDEGIYNDYLAQLKDFCTARGFIWENLRDMVNRACIAEFRPWVASELHSVRCTL